MPSDPSRPPKGAQALLAAYARTVVRRPGAVLVTLAVLLAVSGWATSRLRINANQLDLISDQLVEVQDVRRLIDMIGGTGHLIVALRGDDEARLKQTADDLAAQLTADAAHVRDVTYRVPVQFFQENMVLFVETEDLLEGKARIMRYLRAKMRQANPFYLRLSDGGDEPTVDLSDLQEKYSRVGKKTILDDYYIARDRQMLLILVKPRWDVNDLAKTQQLVAKLRGMMAAYSANNPARTLLVPGARQEAHGAQVAWGLTGSYMTSLEDSFAISESLEPVSVFAFLGIMLVTIVFFRLKVFPSIVVLSGVVVGTLITMGFTYLTVGTLNMITSILGGILMGFGVDYGIHLMFRIRIELGRDKPYDQAVADAVIFAGRPAAVAAVVTGGSFLVLTISKFRGFSQFGFLAGSGTVILGLTMFSWCAAWVALAGRLRPTWPARLVGTLRLAARPAGSPASAIPRPWWLLVGSLGTAAVVCLAAVPWRAPAAAGDAQAGWRGRLGQGVRFNYNSRALMAEGQEAVRLQDEVTRRFEITSDPLAVATTTLAEAKAVYDEVAGHPARYPSVDQVASIYSFVPPPERARANAAILAAWRDELDAMGVTGELLPPQWQAHRALVDKIFAARPYGVDDIPAVYRDAFRSLPEARPENQGYLTFLYPAVDLMDGEKLLAFNREVDVITTADGSRYRSSGLAVLFGKLAEIVLWDGKVTVLLAALWILVLHYLDFRSLPLALASVLPLGLGLVMMLGLMALSGHELNFMNIIMMPILLGFGVSHGLYLLHRFLEGVSPRVALRSVGAAVASSTLTAMAGFASLFAASHRGLRSMGFVATLGLGTTLLVSFTVLAAFLQILDDRRRRGR